jgi:aspartyl-tRNA(Asn)/glutamyl-tRNA(Gln) amidotransferase subunit A
MTVRELGGLLRARKLSCGELIQQTLRSIKERDQFHCFITLTEEQAQVRARELDQELAAGHDRGPFHGIPIALKDLFYTRGVRTTAGSLVFRDFVPTYDSAVLERLMAAGAVSVGKTNLHELAYGITSKNPHFGHVKNPLNPARLAGGSSGGSAAAIAGGFLPMAMGTDTGGSVRIPAAFCGIAGLKPTYGRVSRYGVLPLSFSLDHVGPLGATVEDCALAMNVIAGPDTRDASCADLALPEFNLPALPDLKQVRVGVPANFFFDRIREDVASAVQRSVQEMERLGARATKVQVPDLEAANVAARVIQSCEVAAVYVNQRNASLFGDDVWVLIEQGRMLRGYEYVNAQRIRTVLKREFDAIWRDIDVIICPTTPTTAPDATDETITIDGRPENTRMASTRLVRAINFFGEPALSMPCGTGEDGLPVGLQMICGPFGEPKLLQIAKTLERELT